MYCINCGVKLADTEARCPLCSVRVYHPDLPRQTDTPLYPPEDRNAGRVSKHGLRIVLTAGFLLAAIVCLLCDVQLSGGITWSGYSVGGLAILYGIFILPGWFREYNPMFMTLWIFLLIHLYLLYINYATQGNWFFSFAFPVAGFVGLLSAAVAGLLRYVAKGAVYVAGGALIALGGFMPVMGYLLNLTFFTPGFAFWSLYPGISLVLAGTTLIFLGICRPARQTLARKFFI